MPLRFDLYRRLEPRRPGGDLDAGFRAEVHDPAWFLAKQWQMGEHQGEDAGSPVNVSYVASQVPVDPYGGDPTMDPSVVPPEAIIESEPDEWWTIGRRIRIGLAAAAHLPGGLSAEADSALRLGDLAAPYDRCGGGYDGLTCYRQREQLALPDVLFAGVPATQPADLWDPAELAFGARFTTGNGSGPVLDVARHDGGDLDWFSIRAVTAAPPPAPLPAPTDVLPTRLNYPGAPNPRLWQIEDAHVDVGGFPPDRSHLATMLLIDLVVSHADDWFSFPFTSSVAKIVTLHSVEVRDAFDDVTTLQPPAAWSLFAVDGLAPTALVIWPTVATPINGPLLDDVAVGVDEDANLLWAVERRAAGRELAPPAPELPEATAPPTGQRHADARKEYAYQPSTYVPPFWHPYEIHEVDGRRRFVQGRLANLQTRPPTLMPEPVSTLLADPRAPAQGPVHQIEPAAIPTNGVRLERRYVLGRASDGQPVLWLQRRRRALLAPPVSNLRFDVVEEVVDLS